MCHLREAPPSLVEHVTGVPQVLASVIMASLAKDPKDRPTALDIARILLASGLPQTWDEDRRQAWWAQYDPTAASPDLSEGAISVFMR